MIVEHLVEVYGWEELGKRITIKCFMNHPSVESSLVFLRKTSWAREKVEGLYLATIRPGYPNEEEAKPRDLDLEV